ncbi:WS/DGAT domain-containing protein [Streptomyces sp. NPDC047821]|uniref:WS/DGAT domain-containing protein n=1 Tax=Streptomyces sp. NPDC047821 TaxID=3365488 RepID=UPI0037102E04
MRFRLPPRSDPSPQPDPEPVSPRDHLTWRVEGGTRAHPVILIIMFFDRPLTWDAFVTWHEDICATTPRMQAFVRTGRRFWHRPCWVPETDFSLERHLSHLTVHGSDTRRVVLDTAATLSEAPFPPGRSPWHGYLLDGLTDGTSAYVLKVSHSIADGMRLRQMFLRQAGRGQQTRRPQKAAHTKEAQLRSTDNQAGRLYRRLRNGIHFAAEAINDMRESPYPVPERQTRRSRTYFACRIPTASLRKTASAAGGTIHDTLVAAVADGLHTYHLSHRVERPRLRVFSPFALAADTSHRQTPPMGNFWFIVRFSLAMGDPDPRGQIAAVRKAVTRTYLDQDATDWMGAVARFGPYLPMRLFEPAFLRLCASHDFGFSNIPGTRTPLFVGDAQIAEVYGVAPVMGFSVTATLLSYRDQCHIILNTDPEVISDPADLYRCIEESLKEITRADAAC